MTRNELKTVIREVILEMKKETKKKNAITLTDGGNKVMSIFSAREVGFKWSWKSFRQDANLIANNFGIELFEKKLKQLDTMIKFKPEIHDPSKFLKMHNSIKEEEIVKSNFKKL